jgi:hypothetical protein
LTLYEAPEREIVSRDMIGEEIIDANKSIYKREKYKYKTMTHMV